MLIAHLSDIHLCREHGGRKQRRLIIDLMRSALNRGVEHFLVSGDIVEYSNHRDLQKFIRESHKLGIQASQLSLLPGNHDIFPVSQTKLWRTLFRFAKHKRYYERFFFICRDYFGEILQRKPLIYFRKLSDDHVLFAADSNDYRIRTHRSSARGYLSPDTWRIIDEAIEKYGFQSHKKILMTHHYPFQWGPRNNCDVDFVNLEDVQNKIAERDWHFVACGHSHRNSGVRKIGQIPIINSASNPGKDHYLCSIIDTETEIIPRRIETNLNRRLRMIFTRYQRE